MTPIQCCRCGRTSTVEAADTSEWEATGETGEQMICPGCLTGQEQREVDEDAMDMGTLIALDPDIQAERKGAGSE